MTLNSVFSWLLGDVPAADPSDQDIAREAYVDFLDAQLEGLAPAKADEMRLTLHGEGGTGPTDFATIMGVETRLAGALPPEDARRTYWIVRDRFMRVASLAAIAEHDRWVPAELRPPAPQTATTPLAEAKTAEAVAMQTAGRTAVKLAMAAAVLDKAGTAATPVMRAARDAAQTAHDSALTVATAASKHVADLETAGGAAAGADATG